MHKAPAAAAMSCTKPPRLVIDRRPRLLVPRHMSVLKKANTAKIKERMERILLIFRSIQIKHKEGVAPDQHQHQASASDHCDHSLRNKVQQHRLLFEHRFLCSRIKKFKDWQNQFQ